MPTESLGFSKQDEVWLPASWTERLEDLLLRPGDFTGELVQNVEALDEGINRNRETESGPLEQVGDFYAEARPSNEPSETIELDPCCHVNGLRVRSVAEQKRHSMGRCTRLPSVLGMIFRSKRNERGFVRQTIEI